MQPHMTPEQRFSLRLIRLMLEENRFIQTNVYDRTLGVDYIKNSHPGNNHFISFGLAWDVFGGFDYGFADPWCIDPEECVLSASDLPWPETADGRQLLIDRIDRALETGSWSVQPAVEDQGVAA